MNTELDITEFFNNAAPRDYSASAMELGQDAGKITWQAANDDSGDYPLLDTDEKREAFRAFARSSGGWNNAEIAAWTDTELNALCIQWVSGDIRAADLEPGASDETWAAYEKRAEEGNVSGNIYRGTDGRIYFNIGE